MNLIKKNQGFSLQEILLSIFLAGLLLGLIAPAIKVAGAFLKQNYARELLQTKETRLESVFREIVEQPEQLFSTTQAASGNLSSLTVIIPHSAAFKTVTKASKNFIKACGPAKIQGEVKALLTFSVDALSYLKPLEKNFSKRGNCLSGAYRTLSNTRKTSAKPNSVYGLKDIVELFLDSTGTLRYKSLLTASNQPVLKGLEELEILTDPSNPGPLEVRYKFLGGTRKIIVLKTSLTDPPLGQGSILDWQLQ